MIIYPAPVGGLVLLLCLVWVILEMRKNTAKERKARRQARQEAKAQRRDPKYWEEKTQNQRAKNRELWKNMSKTDRQLYYFGIVCFLLAFLIFAFIGIHAMLH